MGCCEASACPSKLQDNNPLPFRLQGPEEAALLFRVPHQPDLTRGAPSPARGPCSCPPAQAKPGCQWGWEQGASPQGVRTVPGAPGRQRRSRRSKADAQGEGAPGGERRGPAEDRASLQGQCEKPRGPPTPTPASPGAGGRAGNTVPTLHVTALSSRERGSDSQGHLAMRCDLDSGSLLLCLLSLLSSSRPGPPPLRTLTRSEGWCPDLGTTWA